MFPLYLFPVDWKSEGCYNEKRMKNRLLKKTYKVVYRNKEDIEQVFNKCRTFAEKAGYQMFAIKVRKLIGYKLYKLFLCKLFLFKLCRLK